ncbi:histidinol-phosphate transaminase [Kiritimatiella glycovorans]|uniref:Histidinol-phosphate aminotransferase n=1 Tax=Kiritimatiella glycovorans TaxID=1307763 RepID=A0A0G3ED97_9BACT|nr:histidinol-phosphate transaminase [Kiritimatiella glycovorans]AKJ63332.1 Histidinol-phosphate aminotransferase [Kiritimatiella glycovorans]
MNPSLLRRAVREMEAYVPGEQPADTGIIKLNTNENPYPPSPGVSRVLASFDPQRLRKYPDPGCAPLRTLIAQRTGFRDDEILIGNGSDEILALAMRVFVERGGAAGWFDPSYSLYPVLADIEEIRHRPTALDEDFGWNDPDTEGLDLFLLTHPNAPTGMLYEQEAIADLARRFDGVLLIDEAYADFAPRNCLDMAREFGNVLVARSFSKSYSLAGLRVGYAVGSRELIGAMGKIRDSYNVDMLAQEIACAAFADDDHMRRNTDRILATRERIAEALRERGWTLPDSAGNFLWARPPGSAAEWFEALRARGILVRYFDAPRTRRHLRITVGTDEEMDAFLDAVDAAGKD